MAARPAALLDGRHHQHAAGPVRRDHRRGAVRGRRGQHHAARHLPALTPPEWPEWGNPLEGRDRLQSYIASYSPYDRVGAKPYPAILATGGLSDPASRTGSRKKWVAKLRPATTSGKPVLLKINMEAGHGGASGRFDFLKEIALDYAFAVWAVEQGWEA
ncbi:prolyl oligopeptidase family serine peptidase [Caulobacter segnis]